ncbi:MAG: fibronectin type III domain-containing protein [Flavobacteriales bacterium]
MERSITLLLTLFACKAMAINAPTLVSPCGGMFVDPLMMPTAFWNPSAGATSYNAQFSGDPSFVSIQFEVTVPTTSSNLSLWFDFHYYWRVRASDGVTWSAWSGTCDFWTNTIPPPPAPVLATPSCGATSVTSSQTFSWNYATGALDWELQLANNATFTGATSYFTPNMSYLVNGLLTGQTYYWRVRGESLGGWGLWSSSCTFLTQSALTPLNLRAFLQGPLNPTTLLMGDQLRTSGAFPAAEPYTGLGFTGIANAGVSMTAGLLATSGGNAVVDWILVEARHGTTSQVLRSWAMLLQSDGDVMMPDGSAPSLTFPMSQVRIAVRHRNHFGAMTSATVTANGSTITCDMTLAGTALYGTEPTATVGVRRALWCGDTNGDGTLRYVGANNDRDPILTRIGGSVPTATVGGYYRDDVNLDAVVRYVGTSNDRDGILVNIGGSVPTATRAAQLP